MLLLMVQSQGDQLPQPGLIGMAQQRVHGAVDEGAIARDLLDPGAGDEATLRPGMPGAHGLVIRVEDVGVGIVEGAVSVRVLPEDERLEEPRDVGPVPLRRAHVRHRLDRLVLCAQDRGQPLGGGPNMRIGIGEIGRRFSTGHFHEIRPFAPPGAVAHAGYTVRFTLPRWMSDQARLVHFSPKGQVLRPSVLGHDRPAATRYSNSEPCRGNEAVGRRPAGSPPLRGVGEALAQRGAPHCPCRRRDTVPEAVTQSPGRRGAQGGPMMFSELTF